MAQGLRGQMAHVRRLWIHPSWRRASPTGILPGYFQVDVPVSQVLYFPYAFTVTARNANTTVDTGYLGVVQFSSDGVRAVLPANYTFTGADAGVHVFSTTLRTIGTPFITVADVSTPTVNGSAHMLSTVRAIVQDANALGGVNPNSMQSFLSRNTGGFDSVLPTVQFSVTGFQLCVGDFNGDGVSDVAVANNPAGTQYVTVLLGNGNGTFKAGQTYALSETSSFDIATADLNGDGKLDLAVPVHIFGATSLAILLGNGDATFQAEKTYTIAGNGIPYGGIAIADLNGDGKPDVAVALFSGGGPTVAILLGNGNGTFGASQTFSTGGTTTRGTKRLVLADVNGDGIPDICATIIYANTTGSFASVLLGNGNGTFQAFKTFTTGTQSSDIVAADLNGDGKVDLAVDNYYSNTVSILLGNNNGTFQAKTDFAGPSNTGVIRLLGYDLDGDGNLDMVLCNGTGTNFGVGSMLGNGNGTFAGQTHHVGVGVTGASAFLSFALFNVDGVAKFTVSTPATATSGAGFAFTVTAISALGGTRTDYVGSVTFASSDASATLPASYSFAPSDSGVHVFTATLASVSSQTITATDTANSSLTGHSSSITVGNALDIIVNNLTDVTLGVLLGNGNGTFAAMTTFAQTATFKNFAVADLNGDAHQDIVAFNISTSHIVSTMLGNGNGTFQAETDFAQNTGTFQWLAAAPLHGGTMVDAAYIFNGGTCVLLGNGNGTFGAAATYNGTTGSIRIVIADVNGDSNPDLVVTGSSVVGILLGNGNGTFKATQQFAIKSTGQFTAVADVNNDTTLDLVTTSTANVVCVSLGNGNGTFASGAATTYATGNGPRGLVCLDLNGDGVNDLAVCNYTDSTVSVLLGNNNGTFQAKTDFTTAGAAYTIAAADISGDGKIDLVVTDQSTNQVSILLGNGNGTFKAKTDLTVGTSPRQIALARTTQ